MPLALMAFLIFLVGYEGAAEWMETVTLLPPVWASAAFFFSLLLTEVAMFKKEGQSQS